MFIVKKNYFLIIESIKDLDLKKIKKRNKFSVIYRNNKKIENFEELSKFRKACKIKGVRFFVANNIDLATNIKSDGLYLSSYNNSLKSHIFKKSNFHLIGSAHNFKEITFKIKQGCSLILLSKLFMVNYDKKAPYLGIVKFNNNLKVSKNLIPLGGINITKLNNLKNVHSCGFAILSEIKKKPADILNRLF